MKVIYVEPIDVCIANVINKNVFEACYGGRRIKKIQLTTNEMRELKCKVGVSRLSSRYGRELFFMGVRIEEIL